MRRPIALSLIMALILACTSSTGPEGSITGTFVGDEIGLLASTTQVGLSVPCITARFPPIVPASDGSFDLSGKVIGSPKGFFDNRPARLTGQLRAGGLDVNYALNLDGVWPEPTARTLTQNDTANYVVNATCIQ